LFALNYSVGYIEKLPYSVLHITSIFTKETILIYMIIISLILFFSLKRKEVFYVTLGLVLILSTCFTFTEINRERQQKIIFYASGKQSAIGFINGKQQTLLADSVLVKDKIVNKFQLAGAKFLFGIQSENAFALDTVAEYYQKLPKELKPLYSLGNYFLFHNKRIAIIDSLHKPSGAVSKLYVDYLWIRNNPKIQIADLKQLYEPGMIIIDGSNSYYKTEKWMAEFRKAGLKAYSLKNSGAYVVEL
jgi:competence protein ComEC